MYALPSGQKKHNYCEKAKSENVHICKNSHRQQGARPSQTRSSAVAVIADRTTYCLQRTVYWQTIKPVSVSPQVDERLVYARSDLTGRVYERTQTQA